MNKEDLTVSEAVSKRHIELAKTRTDSKINALREQGYRRDAISFTKNQLEILESTIYETFYSNPQDAFLFLPVNTSVPASAETYSYRMVDAFGQAKVVGDGAQDRPLVDADLSKTSLEVVEFGTGYSYTIGDQERGQILDFDYVQFKARLAAQYIARAHSDYALLGGAGVQGGNALVKGFFNNASVNIGNEAGTDYTIVDSTWTALPAGTAQYAACTKMIHEVAVQSTGVHRTTDLILSTYCWTAVEQTVFNASASSKSVLSALRENYPSVAFHLSESGTGAGVAGVDRNIAYEKNSANAEYIASDLYTEATPDKAGFSYTVQSRGRGAGTVVRYPLSMVYGDIVVV